MQEAFYLKFYLHEGQRHRHLPLHVWLLQKAQHLGIRGGSAFKAIAGYGRHHTLHEEHFFELGGDLPVTVEFVLDPNQSEQLLTLLQQEELQLFYLCLPVKCGLSGTASA